MAKFFFKKNKNYGSPLSMTSQFYFCPVPFRMDTYSGCSHNCLYCFANNSNQKYISDKTYQHQNFSFFVTSAKLSTIKKYLDVAFEGAKNTFTNQEAIAIEFLRKRVPIHFGGMSDPLQPIEKSVGVTYETLKLFKKYEYPIILSSKGRLLLDPKYKELLMDYKNIFIQISLIDDRQEVISVLEPGTASVEERLKILETYKDKLTAVRIQPFIIQLTDTRIIPLLDKLKERNVNHVMVEGLKFMAGNKEANKRISEAFKVITGKEFDLEAYYKAIGGKYNGGDLELPTWRKYEYSKIFQTEIKKRGMTFGCADNDLRFLGDSFNCCLGSMDLPGFEGGLKHNIGHAVFEAMKRGDKTFTRDIIEKEWISDGKFRLVMSNEKAKDKFGDDPDNQTSNRKIKELFDNEWERGGKNSPCQMCNVKYLGKGVYKILSQEELEAKLKSRGHQKTL